MHIVRGRVVLVANKCMYYAQYDGLDLQNGDRIATIDM